MGEKNMARSKGSKEKISACKCQPKGAVKDTHYNVVSKSASCIKTYSRTETCRVDGRTIRIAKVANKIMDKYDKAFSELSKK
jgi:hypothetical protein